MSEIRVNVTIDDKGYSWTLAGIRAGGQHDIVPVVTTEATEADFLAAVAPRIKAYADGYQDVETLSVSSDDKVLADKITAAVKALDAAEKSEESSESTEVEAKEGSPAPVAPEGPVQSPGESVQSTE